MVATLWETVAKRVRAESIEECAEIMDSLAEYWGKKHEGTADERWAGQSACELGAARIRALKVQEE